MEGSSNRKIQKLLRNSKDFIKLKNLSINNNSRSGSANLKPTTHGYIIPTKAPMTTKSNLMSILNCFN